MALILYYDEELFGQKCMILSASVTGHSGRSSVVASLANISTSMTAKPKFTY
jgi:hypothetical protein